VKFLFDENLSPRLIPRLTSLFPSAIHVRDVGLKQSSDSDIWDYAKQNDCILFTADNDFRQRALELGPPPQIILMERCDFPLRVIEELIRRHALRINDFVESNKALLILRR
jgi:predicted nuclease of predicted toxin-antitoxin system